MNFLRARRDKLSSEEVAEIEAQRLPTFRQFLAIAERTGKSVIFDVNEPPVGHPYHLSYLNRTLEEVLDSGLPHNKVCLLTRNL